MIPSEELLNQIVHIPLRARVLLPVLAVPACLRVKEAPCVIVKDPAESLYIDRASPAANTELGIVRPAVIAMHLPTSPIAAVVVVVERGIAL
jgi:hypothetical protein